MVSAVNSMTRTRKIAWAVAAVLFALATIGIHYEVKIAMRNGRAGSVGVMGNIKVGMAAPDFSLSDLSNQTVTLSSFRGRKVVLLDFWATWCGPCRMEMAGLQDLYGKFKDRGLEILSVNQGESADQARNFIQRKKYSFHVVLDQDEAVGNRYGVRGIPTLALVDKKGEVRWIRVGYSPSEGELSNLLGRLTAE